MIKLDLYNQWDPLWADMHLGSSPFKMRDSGCYATSVTMILSAFGIKGGAGGPLTPGEFVTRMDDRSGFGLDGMLNWDAVGAEFPWAYWYDSQWTTRYQKAHDVEKLEQSTAIARIQRIVSLGIPVIACVDHLGNDEWPDHAVVIYDAPEDPFKWMMHDPDGGLNMPFSGRYGDPMLGLYGYRVVIGPPQSWPDSSDGILKAMGDVAWKLSQLRKAYDKLDSRLKNVLPAQITTYSREALDDIINLG